MSTSQAGLIYRYQVAQVQSEALGPMVEVSVQARRADQTVYMWQFLLSPEDATGMGEAIRDVGQKLQSPHH